MFILIRTIPIRNIIRHKKYNFIYYFLALMKKIIAVEAIDQSLH